MTQTPSVGRIVHYVLTDADEREINRRRRDFDAFSRANRPKADEPGEFPGRSGHVGHVGNETRAGDVFPAVIVRAWGTSPGSSVNLKVLLDGSDDYWATSRTEGDGPGHWHWPERT